jgi:hypothetical protein
MLLSNGMSHNTTMELLGPTSLEMRVDYKEDFHLQMQLEQKIN